VFRIPDQEHDSAGNPGRGTRSVRLRTGSCLL